MFSKEKINKGRQPELDIARGLAVLFMIFIHCQQFFANENVQETVFGRFTDFVGGVPAAPVFMFLLGVGIVYSKKSTTKILIKRGLLLILSGYLLNFIKGFTPNMLQWYLSHNTDFVSTAFKELLSIDILQFAGLAMILFGLFKKLKLNNWAIGFIGLGFGIINLFIMNIETDSYVAALTGLIWGSNEISYFPFLVWIFYPIAGFLFGNFLIHCEYKNKFYSYLIAISFVFMVVLGFLFPEALKSAMGLNSEIGYYHHSLFGNIIFTMFILCWISILHFSSRFIPSFLKNTINRWSKNVTEIYFIQWILICWIVLITEFNTLSMLPYLLLLVTICAGSDWFSCLYLNIKSKKHRRLS